MEFTDVKNTIDYLSAKFEAAGLTELELEAGELHVRLVKAAAPAAPVYVPAAPAAAPASAPAAAAPAPEPAAALVPEGRVVKSPMVGTFYASSAPGEAPFVKVGDPVKKGDTLCIIEAMKMLNEIESEYDGTVMSVLAANGSLVEYGQPIIVIS